MNCMTYMDVVTTYYFYNLLWNTKRCKTKLLKVHFLPVPSVLPSIWQSPTYQKLMIAGLVLAQKSDHHFSWGYNDPSCHYSSQLAEDLQQLDLSNKLFSCACVVSVPNSLLYRFSSTWMLCFKGKHFCSWHFFKQFIAVLGIYPNFQIKVLLGEIWRKLFYKSFCKKNLKENKSIFKMSSV